MTNFGFSRLTVVGRKPMPARQVFSAIVYVLRTGCQWKALPREFGNASAELLRNLLLNCSIDAVSLYPTYRKPFDLIFNRVKNNEWSGREDLNLRPPGPEPDFAAC
jgi:transposase